VHDAALEMQQVADDYWATHEYFVQGSQVRVSGAGD
jgi:hypothetical protein